MSTPWYKSAARKQFGEWKKPHNAVGDICNVLLSLKEVGKFGNGQCKIAILFCLVLVSEHGKGQSFLNTPCKFHEMCAFYAALQANFP